MILFLYFRFIFVNLQMYYYIFTIMEEQNLFGTGIDNNMNEELDFFVEDKSLSQKNDSQLSNSETIKAGQQVSIDTSTMSDSERVVYVMRSEGMNASQFAQSIGIKVSSLSHVMNGRNKPSLDIMQKILRRFQHINPSWLIVGQGNVYVDGFEPSNNKQSKQDIIAENAEKSEVDMSSNAVADATPSPASSSSAHSSVAIQSQAPVISVDAIAEKVAQLLSAKTDSETKTIQTNEQEKKTDIDLLSNVIAQNKQPRVTKVIVFYSDNTFEQFVH